MNIFLDILGKIGFAKIGMAFLIMLCFYFYIDNSLLQNNLKRAKQDLNLAIKINESNEKLIKRLQKQREQDLQALQEVNNKKYALEKTLNEVKEFINDNQENNTTKLFNAVIDRLWENSTRSSGKK